MIRCFTETHRQACCEFAEGTPADVAAYERTCSQYFAEIIKLAAEDGVTIVLDPGQDTHSFRADTDAEYEWLQVYCPPFWEWYQLGRA